MAEETAVSGKSGVTDKGAAEMWGQSVSNILPSGAHPADLTIGSFKYVV